MGTSIVTPVSLGMDRVERQWGLGGTLGAGGGSSAQARGGWPLPLLPLELDPC